MTSTSEAQPGGARPALAYHDAGFLDSDEGRPLRILSEYLQPLEVFRRRRLARKAGLALGYPFRYGGWFLRNGR